MDRDGPPSEWDRGDAEAEALPLDALSRLVEGRASFILDESRASNGDMREAILVGLQNLNCFCRDHHLEGVVTPAVCDLLLAAFQGIGGRLSTMTSTV